MAELTEQQKRAAREAYLTADPGTSLYATYAAGLAEGAKPQPASADDAETVREMCAAWVAARHEHNEVDSPDERMTAALAVARRGWVQAGATIPLEALDDLTEEVWQKHWMAHSSAVVSPKDAVNSILRIRRAKYAPAPKQDAAVEAATHMDWGQVVRNGGPPCFHREAGRFCARAERWGGHEKGTDHNFVSLADMIRAAIAAAKEAQ